MKSDEANALLLDALEHERGEIQLYDAALRCALSPDLKAEWTKYREEARRDAGVVEAVCRELGLDPDQRTPGRAIVASFAGALRDAIAAAQRTGDGELAQLVACECVVLAEVKEHAVWDLLSHLSEHLVGSAGALLRATCEGVHDRTGEHLMHTKGWYRELCLARLGMPAALPPPEDLSASTPAVAEVPEVAEAADAEVVGASNEVLRERSA